MLHGAVDRVEGYSRHCTGMPALGVGHARGGRALQETFGRSAHPEGGPKPWLSPFVALPFSPLYLMPTTA